MGRRALVCGKRPAVRLPRLRFCAGYHTRRSPSQQAMIKQWGKNLLATRCTRGGQPAGGHRQQTAVPQGTPGHGLRPQGKGKTAHGPAVFGVPRHRHKVRLDPAGAHRAHPDAAGRRLPPQGAAVTQQKRLGGRIHIKAGQRLERGGGADLQHPAAPPHVGQHRGGNFHGGAAVHIDHIARLLKGHIPPGAKLSKASGIDQHPHVGLFPLQEVPQLQDTLLFGQIQGKAAHGGAQPSRQLLHPPAPAGHAPDLVQSSLRVKPLDKRPPQAGGRPRHDGDLHAYRSPFQCRYGSVQFSRNRPGPYRASLHALRRKGKATTEAGPLTRSRLTAWSKKAFFDSLLSVTRPNPAKPLWGAGRGPKRTRAGRDVLSAAYTPPVAQAATPPGKIKPARACWRK